MDDDMRDGNQSRKCYLPESVKWFTLEEIRHSNFATKVRFIACRFK